MMYFGLDQYSKVATLDGTVQTNPYFYANASLSSYLNKWVMVVGYVYPDDYTGSGGEGGVYNCETGAKISGTTDFKWVAGVTSCFIRAYFNSSTLIGNTAYMYGPRVEVCNGMEVPLPALLPSADLLDGYHADTAASGNTVIVRDSAGRAKVAAPSAADDIARKDTVDAHANATTGIHGATSADTPNALVARDGNGGTTLRALQLKKSDGTPYLDASDGLVKLFDSDGFNAGTSGYRTVKTYTQADAKPAMILLAPVYADTYLAKNGFMGTVYKSRGASYAWNMSEKYNVICTTAYCTTAYNEARLNCTGSNPNVRIVQTTYNDTGYYALYFPTTAQNRITLDGLFWGDPIEISDATGYPVTEVTYNVGPYAIVESGSNSYGNWIKFSDGTMIQYKTFSVIEETGPTNWTVTFPTSFTVEPVFSIINKSAFSGTYNPGVEVVTNRSLSGFLFSNSTYRQDANHIFYVILIGRWKE